MYVIAHGSTAVSSAVSFNDSLVGNGHSNLVVLNTAVDYVVYRMDCVAVGCYSNLKPSVRATIRHRIAMVRTDLRLSMWYILDIL